MIERLDALWKLLDQRRSGGPSIRTAAEVVRLAHDAGIPVESSDLWDMGARLGFDFSESLVPPELTAFIAALVSGRPVESVLDPWVGLGTLVGPVASALGATRTVGRHPNQAAIEAASILLPGADLRAADLAKSPEPLGSFDVVVCSPPFGMQPRAFTVRDVAFHDDYGHEILARSADLLRHGGVGVFVVAPRFLRSGESGVLRKLKDLGLAVKAIFDVPAGAFRPLTMIPTMVVVVERGKGDDTVFVGQLSGDRQQVDLLVANFKKRKAGPRLEAGALVPLDGFRGLRALTIEREISDLARRTGGSPTTLGEIATITRLKTPDDVPEDQPNSFFFPLILGSKLRTTRGELPKGVKEYVHVAVDPDKAVAGVVVGFLDGTLGQRLREGLAVGAAIQRIPVGELPGLGLWLPSLQTQVAVAAVSRRIEVLTDELSELQQELWDRPSKVHDLRLRVDRVNHADSFQEWVDTLPFPLASVLWTYHTVKEPLKRYLQLEYFFEALAQYVAVMLMSGVRRDRTRFGAEWASVQKDLTDHHMSIRHATFGTWMAVAGKLAKTVRSGLSADADARAYWLRLFALDDERLLSALVSKDMMTLLQKANKYRNDWRGHGGVVGDDEARRREGHFADLLGEFRHLVGLRWRGCLLVLPVSGRFIKGAHRYQVRKVVGVRLPFETAEVDLRYALEDGCLHLVSIATGEVCPLLPFVRLGASPKEELNACYFFNRVDGRESRWVSFHFEQRPEVVMSSDEMITVLDSLASSADMG